MKYLKVLSLALMVAVALAASIGSASATVLCKNASSPCSSPYPKGTVIHGVIKQELSKEEKELIKLNDNETEVLDECFAGSTFTWHTANAGSSTETVIATFNGEFETTLTGCKRQHIRKSSGKIELHYDSGSGDAVVTGKEFEVEETIGSALCTYGYGSGITLGTLQQPSSISSDTVFELHATVKKIGGSFICPTSTVWKGTYTVTSPVPLYVTSS
jgi:hypothetical protein